MSLNWINRLSLLSLLLLVGGCASDPEKLLPHGDATMMDVWNQQTAGGGERGLSNRRLLDARQHLRRPLESGYEPIGGQASYSRTAQSEIYRQFHRLPNPDLVMYVFPHLAGSDPVPVPGYSTVFPLYQRVQYAMPGERLDNY